MEDNHWINTVSQEERINDINKNTNEGIVEENDKVNNTYIV